VKAAGLPDRGVVTEGVQHNQAHPAWDQDGVHEIYRGWRAVANRYAPERIFIAEAWVPSNERLARYLRPDELHTAFQFDFLRAPWRATSSADRCGRRDIGGRVRGCPTDVGAVESRCARTVTRYSRSQPERSGGDRLGARSVGRGGGRPRSGPTPGPRVRAAAVGVARTAYIYQGEELGLEEVEDIPDEVRQDPTWVQSGFTDVGRDGCRVPLPWSGSAAPYGFSPSAVPTWLPQPGHWARTRWRPRTTTPARS
jgi:alpha-glucosidase